MYSDWFNIHVKQISSSLLLINIHVFSFPQCSWKLIVVNTVFFFAKKGIFVIEINQRYSDFILGLVVYTIFVILIALIMPLIYNVLLLVFQVLGSIFDVVKLELE
jgi:hypothetical protein